MLCDKCKNREATYHLKQTRQGKVSEHHLCEYCAYKQGLEQQAMGASGALSGKNVTGIGNIFYPAGGIPEFGQAANKNIVCAECKQTYHDFRRTGLFGCSHCYQAFSERLEPVFRRVQGNVRHKGSPMKARSEQVTERPVQSKLRSLKAQLKSLVKQEAYEEAAKIRDQIRAIESQDNPEGRQQT